MVVAKENVASPEIGVDDVNDLFLKKAPQDRGENCSLRAASLRED